MSVAIVVLETLATPFIYEAEEPQQGNWSGEWGNALIAVHVKVPEGLDPQCIMAVRADDGTIQLVEDPQKVEAKTAQAWTSLRSQRNALLAQTDWTRLDDVNLTDEQKTQWAEYRVALRDVTKGLEDPARVQWPEKPN